VGGFYYFTPGPNPPDLVWARANGLGYAFDAGFPARGTSRGPKGRPAGHIFRNEATAGEEQLRLDEELQEWRRISTRPADAAEVWIGWNRESPPGPADLERTETIEGFAIKLADGREWKIPVVSYCGEEGERVPPILWRTSDIDDTGREVAGGVKAVRRWLWDLTAPAWDWMIEGVDPITNEMIWPIFDGIIQANYYARTFELYKAGAIDYEHLRPREIVALAIGWTTWTKWNEQKKTKPPADLSARPIDGSGSERGNGAASRATAPTVPIS
jgi:hypothetical protein